MKSLILLLFLFTFVSLCAEVLEVPEDYSTIQEAINESADGDSVLAAPGIYYENINFMGKGITVSSWYAVTADTSYISQTVIDGGENDSVVKFISMEDSLAILTGFTILNGIAEYGGGIYCESSSPGLFMLKVENNQAENGGGICCFLNSYTHIDNVIITNNSAEEDGGGLYCGGSSEPCVENTTIMNNTAYWGGGIYSSYSNPSFNNIMVDNNLAVHGGGVCCHWESSPSFENITVRNNSSVYSGGMYFLQECCPSLTNVTITGNYADFYGGMGCYDNSIPVFSSENRCNIYLNNSKYRGKDINTDAFINVIVDTFTVVNPTDYYTSPIMNYSFDILQGIAEQVNTDLYVSPIGDNNNSGLSIDEPLQTIQYASSIIYADSLNPCTIFLAEGTYSPVTNGESYPIQVPDYVSLIGVNEEDVILDADGTDAVMWFFNIDHLEVSNLTITNGFSEEFAGGIFCDYSSPNFTNLTLTENFTNLFGAGGIYCRYYSSPRLENITITNNSTNGWGGGIKCRHYSNPSLVNVTISDNSATYGGGMGCCDMSNPSLENVIVTGNSAGHRGGGIYFNDSDNPSLTNVLIADNRCDFQGGGLCCHGANPSLVNVTIADNAANIMGGGIFSTSGSDLCLINCILWDNVPYEVEFYYDFGENSITVAYSDIQGEIDGIETYNNGSIDWLEGNINNDPEFVDVEAGNYHLLEDSACIDSGIAYFEYMGEVMIDLSEDEYNGDAPDMGAFEYSASEINAEEVPVSTDKFYNYPNPFNPETVICFSIKAAGSVCLNIYDIKGRLVRRLVDNYLENGEYRQVWNGKDDEGKVVGSGIYFARLTAVGQKAAVKKLIMLK